MQLSAFLISLVMTSGALAHVVGRQAAAAVVSPTTSKTSSTISTSSTSKTSTTSATSTTSKIPTTSTSSTKSTSSSSSTKSTSSTTSSSSSSTNTSPVACPTTRPAFCLSDADATTIVNDFINLLTHTQSNFNTTLANQLLAPDFSDQSDSIDYLEEQALGSITFASKAAFISGAGSQPPFPSVTTDTLFHTCTQIAWRYTLNTTPLPVRGIDLFTINCQKQIETVYAELNSGAFLYNVGSPECQSNWTIPAPLD